MEGPENFAFKPETDIEYQRVNSVAEEWRAKLDELQLAYPDTSAFTGSVNEHAVTDLSEPELAQLLHERLQNLPKEEENVPAEDVKDSIANDQVLQLLLARAFAMTTEWENTGTN